MEVAVGAARWVVGKALGPVADGLLEAWAASRELGPNVDALKMELLYVQGMLNNTHGREIDNPALNMLLQKLRDLAYNAEDVLDELDYFRIQDQLEGTYEAADEHAKGCVCNLFLNAQHTARVVGKLPCFSPGSRAASHGDPSESREEDARQQILCCGWPCAKRRSTGDTSSSVQHDHKANKGAPGGCMRKVASVACNTIRDVGKRLHCSSLPLDHDDDADADMPVLSGLCKRNTPQRKHVKKTPKLEFDRVDLSKRMKHIVEQLQPVCAKVTAILNIELLGSLNIELLGSSRTTAQNTAKSRAATTSDILEPKLHGRDLTKKSIIDSITHDNCDKDLTILPIVGPGGIGKTTLVQYIYNSQEVQNHFQVKVWICVSQNFNVSKLIEEIEKAIPSVKGEKMGRAEELIEDRLNSRRFLVILDDIWKCEPEDWKRLLVPLTKGQAKGNTILVTSRFPAVAEMVKNTDFSVNLKGLDHKMFREFFLACVFGDEQSINNQSELLIKIGDEIAHKLKGSPLAAKTVGRLLRNHLDPYHWTRVLESREWEIQTSEYDIMPALKLSYDYLPFHLQQCFFYCALFPEDYEFDSEGLINFWIGRDILRSGGRNKTTKDVGLGNLNDLVNNGFFKKDEKDGHPYYIIHDLLHDLTLNVASHDCLSLCRSNLRSVEIWPSIRHLSIIIDGDGDSNEMTNENFESELRRLKTRLKVENLQTLIIFGELDQSFINIFADLFKDANALRVLCLPLMSYPVERLLHNFSALLHLRYLSVGTSVCEMHLPINLSRFYHLKILDLENWDGHRDLPRDMCNLANLCHFLTSYDDLHSGIYNVGKLKLLQELKAFKVNNESKGFEQKQLEHLIELRELGIYNLEKIHTKEEAAEAKLINKTYLQKLTLDWDGRRPNIEPDVEAQVLEVLQPHRNLQELNIRGHKGPSCPTWLGEKLSVEALQSLHLFDVSWEVFPPFGKMLCLGELTLDHIATIKEFGLEQRFCKLIRLTLYDLESFEKWVPRDTHHLFPILQALFIRDCPKLLELPCSNYILDPLKQDRNTDWFPILQALEIVNCPEILSLPPIPWTETLCCVIIRDVGSKLLKQLVYSGVRLEITGNDDMHSLEQLLVFNNLTELQELEIFECPPLELKHLLMLTSLKKLSIYSSNTLIVPSVDQGDVECQHPLEYLGIQSCSASGKELTQLLSHLPKLSNLEIGDCENMTRLVVGVDVQQTIGKASSSISWDVKMEDAKQEISEEERKDELAGEEDEKEKEGEEAVEEDGLVVFPAHLSDSLQYLSINGENAVVHSLSALQALRTLGLCDCELASFSSSCFPFPSSLQDLHLQGLKCLKTLQPLSNLTSLTSLFLQGFGEDLRCEGLLHLLTQGQLSELHVYKIPNFFAGWDPTRGLQHEEGQLLLSTSSKLRDLDTDDFAGVLAAPICRFLSSSLIELAFYFNDEVECFTKVQEESLHLLTSLQKLEFWDCQKLRCLPAGLHKLTNLKRLRIMACPALGSLPKDGLPSSLQVLDVRFGDNEELKQKCKQLVGTIPEIRI